MCLCVCVCLWGVSVCPCVCICVCLCVSMCVSVPRSFQKLPDRIRVFIILFRSLSLYHNGCRRRRFWHSPQQGSWFFHQHQHLSPPHPRLAWHDAGAWISSPMKSLIVPPRASSLSLSHTPTDVSLVPSLALAPSSAPLVSLQRPRKLPTLETPLALSSVSLVALLTILTSTPSNANSSTPLLSMSMVLSV